ncbi:hypothetical protein POUND7_000324 [Theobroma cacao]
MATPMPPGLPRQPPPSTHNPNFQQSPDSLSDNLQKLNINKPTLPPFIRSPPPPSTSAPSPPISRPGAPPPGVVPRPNVPPNVGSVIPFGAPGGQPLPFGTRSPPGSLPSSKGGGPVISPGGSNASQLIAPPSAFVTPSSAWGGSIRNGPPVGVPPPMTGTVMSPGQAPNMGSFLGSPQGSYPPGPHMQSASPFSAPLAAPFGTQTWSPGQVAPPTAAPDAFQPPRVFGMPPLQPNQLSPAIDQTGTSLEGSWKSNSDQVPRPSPSSSTILHDTRQGNQANPPPPATSDYIVRDTGNCSPRHMRCTIHQIPCTADLLTNCGMQLALLVQPLALPHPSEEPIPVVDFGENGPIRCSRCKGYINPFMKFIDHGRRFICNFCGFFDNTPPEYQCNLGPDGRRRDADVRPELCKGTIEFVATKEYMMRDPMPAVYFFLIDVSMNAIQTGATAAACAAINQVIADLPQEDARTMVGIATFDSTIHFYNLKRALLQPLMLIVPDVQDVYIPLETDIIVQLSESRQHIEQLLESIPTMFLDNRTAESAFVAAVKAAFLAIKSTGGKLLVFQSVLPSVGMLALSARDAEGRSNTSAGEKEVHKLLQPADKTLKTMANEFAECQVCVDVFITTQTYVDIASISLIPGTTGGQVYYYYPFSSVSDPAKLYNDLRWNITRPQGFEAVMRVRCSQGIEVKEYHGNFCKRVPTDVDLPGIDSDKTIMVTLKHDDKLQDGSECTFQCALLYTTAYGQRRIRVSTLSLPCTSSLTNLFRAADLDAQFVCSLKQVANKIPSTPLLQIREQVTNICINNLLAYRKFCTTSTSSGQFVLPEALKLSPLYTLALTKSTGLRIDGRIDDRSFWINIVSHISIPSAVSLVLPRMIAVHNLDLEEEGGSVIPPVLPLSSEYVSEDGIYLLENGVDGLIYIGSLVDSVILQQLFGISSVDETPTQFVLQQYDNSLSKKLNRVINEIRRQWCSYLRLTLCKKGDPSGMLFFSYLIEDPNPKGGQSYSEFLVYLHRKIQSKMS